MIFFVIYYNCSLRKSPEFFSKVLSILIKIKFYNKYIRNKELMKRPITRVG